MPHLVLLGDSIFDNAAYVPAGWSVNERLAKQLPSGWRGTLRAVDGAITCEVEQQLYQLPQDATHLAVSVGGNDALGASNVLEEGATSVADALEKLALVQESFRRDYLAMLAAIRERQLPTLVCTIYDAIPGLEIAAVLALNLFNDVIVREAIRFRCDLLDLRLVCHSSADYSPVSPIEPSADGAEKIASHLAAWSRGDAAGSRVWS